MSTDKQSNSKLQSKDATKHRILSFQSTVYIFQDSQVLGFRIIPANMFHRCWCHSCQV